MEPNLLIGDRLFVSKYSYGYSRHSFPFSPGTTSKRYLEKIPERGDIIVFKTPADNRTDYIKRLIGLPGDVIQIVDGEILLNNIKIKREEIKINKQINCGNETMNTTSYLETLPNGVSYLAVYRKNGTIEFSTENINSNDYTKFFYDN